jgi:predicted transcriptional regulator
MGEAARRAGRRASGELEAQVMSVLWAADGPLTATQVLDRLPGNLAITTVLTILTRLLDKQQVSRERVGRGYAYLPVRDEATQVAEGMFALLEQGSDRRAVLTRFVSELHAEDERILQDLLRRGEEGH